MKPSACLKFPFKEDYENDCLRRAHTVEEAYISAIRMFIVTPKGSRVGNPIGSTLPELLFTLVPSVGLEGVATEFKAELTEQFPGVDFIEVTLERKITTLVDLIIKITFSIPTVDKLIDMEVVLPSIFSKEVYFNINKNDI